MFITPYVHNVYIRLGGFLCAKLTFWPKCSARGTFLEAAHPQRSLNVGNVRGNVIANCPLDLHFVEHNKSYHEVPHY